MNIVQVAILQHLEALVSRQSGLTDLSKTPILVAFSGGLDSSVLLHACHQLLQLGKISKLSAVHLNHGLQAANDAWQQKCRLQCEQYGIDFLTKKIALAENNTVSENAARMARYDFFELQLTKPGILLLGHHQDDQVETLLFRMLRGTGIHGLKGMPHFRPLANGWVLRPLINHSRAQLEQYAEQLTLKWIDDPSNQQSDYSRNFLRNKVIPLIKSKWPWMSRSLVQLSELAGQQAEMLDDVAADDIDSIEQTDGSLNVYQFNQFSVARRKNILHYWVKISSGFSPTSSEITEAVHQFEQSDSNLLQVKASSGWLRCFQKQLYYCDKDEPKKLSEPVTWLEPGQALKLTNGLSLNFEKKQQATQTTHLKLRMPKNNETVWVRPRQGGETAKPVYRSHHSELKKIYQELKIPNWKRSWLPIIYYDDKIAAVPGVFVDQAFADELYGVEIDMVFVS